MVLVKELVAKNCSVFFSQFYHNSSSTATAQTSFLLSKQADCSSSFLVCVIACTRCGLQHVRQAKIFRLRVNHHKSAMCDANSPLAMTDNSLITCPSLLSLLVTIKASENAGGRTPMDFETQNRLPTRYERT